MASSKKIKTGTVQVEGLPELSRALKAIGPDAQAEVKTANRTVAGFVADDAQAAAYALGGAAAKTAPTIRAGGGVGSANVGFGGAGQPWAGGAAWGSIKFKQFKPYKAGIGYFPYPQIVSNADRIEREYVDMLDDIIKRRFPQ